MSAAVRILAQYLLGLCGAALLLPGLYLAGLGGSPYYLFAGAALLFAAVLLYRGQRVGLHVFLLLLGATLAWSVWEAGFDGWALMPRLLFPLLLALLVWPASRGALKSGGAALRLSRRVSYGAVGLAVLLTSAWATLGALAQHAPAGYTGTADAMHGPPDGDWSHYGNSAGGSRYSPLTQITPSNVTSLELAWTFRAGAKQPGGSRQGGLQVTPLMVDGTLYGCTAFTSVFALDPVTGEQRWRHDPLISENDGGHATCRGLAYFRAPVDVIDCRTRLLLGTVANRLIALDAKTGKPCESFGVHGTVDLLAGIGEFPRRWSHPTSPPTIVNGTAVIGAYVVDNQSTQVPPGVVRGYDAVTGRLKWAFDSERADATVPLGPGEHYTPATPNSWSIASGDDALGLVYLPMGNGSPDFFGSERTPGTDRVSTALVALDAETGAVRWSFQAVHHDLWDYDLAAQPVLVEFPTPSGSIPAIILPTKTGQLFVLDRRTGKPLTAVEERAVPRSLVPEERVAPTQPFSVGMPNVAGATLTESDMWGLTPFDQLWCRIKFREARYEGIFTPPGLDPVIRYPGELGGIDWGSVSVDESRGILVVNSNHLADYDQMVTREQAQAEGIVPRTSPKIHSAPGAAMVGTPYAIHFGPFLSGLDVPCQKPPFGFLTAIDLSSRQVLWTRSLGNARNSGPFGWALGLPLPLGAPNIGGSITTRSGLIFIGASQDEAFRAVDIRDGKVLWEARLPAAGHATAMTYLGPDGRQYVLIAAGGRSLRTRGGDHFLAYRLKTN